MPGLVRWLRATQRVRPDTLLVRELPVNGRRVDLVTFTRSGLASAYELKLGSFGRALEQALYNTYSFERSWIVNDRLPGSSRLKDASDMGVGVISLASGTPELVVSAPSRRIDKTIRDRIARKVYEQSRMSVQHI